MSETAFKFLLHDRKRPFLPSTCYIVADPKVRDRRTWTLELDPPKDADWVLRVDDLKDWMLHGTKPVRKMFYDVRNHLTPFRELHRDEVFREYLRTVLDKIPTVYQHRRKYALMPSISDDRVRARYKDAIEAALPDVAILPEPEMVAEYFRLLKRTLTLEEGANNVILVLDVGASTADMTLVISRRDQTIVDVDSAGRQRDQRIRALRGDSVAHAGRWVDKEIARELGLAEPGTDENRTESDLLLRAIENAKVVASRTGTDTAVEYSAADAPLVVTQIVLEKVSKALAHSLVPLFQKLCERLYSNNTSTEDARTKSESRFRERGIDGPSDAYRLIDVILLAGGSSQLKSFESAMLSSFFPDGHNPAVLHVGTSFAVAAAAGGLAHLLHNYAPPRLRETDALGAVVVKPALESTLQFPLLLGVKQSSKPEERVPVLEPNDPFIDDGGIRPIEGVPPLAAGSRPKMRLVPGGAAGVEARKGRSFRAMEVRQSPGKMNLKWDAARQRATVLSDQVDNTGSTLWIDAEPLRKRHEPALDPFDGEIEPGTMAVDQADDIIFDFGMSKIVAITADKGLISANYLERSISDGIDAGHLVPSGDYTESHNRLDEPFDTGIDEASAPAKPISSARQVETEPFGKEPLVTSVEPVDPKPLIALSDSSSKSDISPGLDWTLIVPDAQFSYALEELRDVIKSTAPHQRFDDIVVTLLAIAVRPMVLLAGPPGCGKTTLVRTIAKILGLERGKTFHEIAVQAHWENDDALFGTNGQLCNLLNNQTNSHLVLFDEFNLTRPEYYLSRIFHSLDSGFGPLNADSKIAPFRVLGTMNVDDSSRPPSPKVTDRCFLLELEQMPWDAEGGASPPDLGSIKPLVGLPSAAIDGVMSDQRIDAVLKALEAAVFDNDLRHDLLPSRRVLSDVRALLSLHHRLDLTGKDLLSRDDLVDRILASRVLVKLSGAFDQVQPVIEALEAIIEGMEELQRTRRRLKLARQQSRLGFVSPWQ